VTAEPAEIIKVFESAINNNDGTYEKWLAVADIWLNNFLTGKLKNKYQAKDIVHDLFIKLCDGKRKWDKDKYPDFVIYFFMLIKSQVWNLAKYEEKLVNATENYYEEDNEENGNTGLIIDNVNFLGLDEILSGADERELYKLCLEKLNDDEDGCIIFMEAAEGKPNQEIAKELGVEIRFVENAKKRVKRKLLPLFSEFMGTGKQVRSKTE
jgi:RNA polymerase sigma factor (sigma-70 family)